MLETSIIVRLCASIDAEARGCPPFRKKKRWPLGRAFFKSPKAQRAWPSCAALGPQPQALGPARLSFFKISFIPTSMNIAENRYDDESHNLKMRTVTLQG